MTSSRAQGFESYLKICILIHKRVDRCTSHRQNKNTSIHFFTIKPIRCSNFTNLFWHETTCFGQFVCPSPGVYSLYTQQWYMSYRFVVMMDRRTVRNMQSFMPKWICEIGASSWFHCKEICYDAWSHECTTFQHSTCVRNSGSSSLRSLHWISPALFMARVCLCQSFRLYESNLLFTLFSLSFSICSLPSCKSAQSVKLAGHINKTVLNRN
jgi:hypothetical protein